MRLNSWLLYECAAHIVLIDRLPFDWKTPFGYPIAFFLACIVTYSILSSILPVVCTGIGGCMLMISFLQDALNKFHTSESKMPNTNGKELKKLFYDSIEDFVELKQLRAALHCVHLFLCGIL